MIMKRLWNRKDTEKNNQRQLPIQLKRRETEREIGERRGERGERKKQRQRTDSDR